MPVMPACHRRIGGLPLSAPLLIIAGSLALTGCASVPDSGLRPAVLSEVSAARSLSAGDSANWPGDGWWQAMGDQQLTVLVEEGLANAPDLAVALARYRNAAAVAQQAAGATLPSLDVQGKAALDKQSYNNGFPKEFLPQGWNDSGQLAASLGFDLDLWGRNRAALRAARSEATAAELDARQARLIIASGIAAAYVDLDRLLGEQAVRRRMLDARLASADLVGKRVAQGLDMRASLSQAQASAASARADLAAADEAVLLRRHQLAALIGAGPDRGLEIAAPRLSIPASRGVPDSATTELLARRPDIVAARARVEAASQRIKVARADFFPAFRLSALIGVQSLGLGKLLESDSSFGSVGPAFTLPVFHGGALQGRYRAAGAGYDAAVADYNRTVLAGYQQAADAVTSQRAQRLRQAEAANALRATEEAHGLLRRRYEAGLATYLDVLASEDRLLQARLAANGAAAAVRSADLALIRSLGGGFSAAEPTNTTDTAKD